MANTLFVGGLPYETTQDELHKLFAGCGRVTNVKLIMDRDTGRSKGFGFVEMSSEADAQAALKKLNGTTLGQRQLFINEARPQENRPGGSPEKSAGARVPGFVERRSGVRDRRRQPEGEKKWSEKPALGGERRAGFVGGERNWGAKPGGFGGAKKWAGKPGGFGEKPREKPAWSSDKREGGENRWVKKPFGGEKKWGAKPGGLGGEKKWGDKPAAGGPKKWESKPSGFSGPKKWGGKPSGFGGKPGGFGGKRKAGGNRG